MHVNSLLAAEMWRSGYKDQEVKDSIPQCGFWVACREMFRNQGSCGAAELLYTVSQYLKCRSGRCMERE